MLLAKMIHEYPIETSGHPQVELIFEIDSGSNEHLVKEEDSHLLTDLHDCCSDLVLRNASGDRMDVIGSGKICDILGEALIHRNLECHLLSPTKLRQHGWTFIQWPAHVDPLPSGVLLDPEGCVALISDRNLKVNISNMYPYDTTVADVTQLHASLTNCNMHANNV